MAEWKKVVVSGSSADLLNISASGNILPKTDNAVDLGASGLEFKNLFIDGTAEIDALVADTADINAGTVDGITSLTAAGDLDIGAHGFRAQTLTADGQTSGRVAIYGANGVLSEDSDLSFSGDTLTATKIGAFTAAGAIDFGNQAMTNVDINSGAIDGAVIGGASAAAGTFTSLNASLNTALSGDVALGNALADDINVAGHITGSAKANVSMSLASTGSFGQLHATKLFGDGANITGIAFQIDGLSNDLDASTLVDADLFVAADVGSSNEEKKITFGNVKSAIVDSITGDVDVAANGTATIQAGAVHGTMLNADVVDDSSIGLSSNQLIIKTGGVTNAMLDNSTISGVSLGNNLNSLSAAANGGISLSSYNGSAAVSNLQLDIDGMTDINAGLASGDLFIVDDGASGTNRKTTVDRIATLFAGNGIAASSAVLAVEADGSSLSVSSDGVKVAAQGITEAELHTSVAGGGLVGGNNTPLAVGAGTGVTVNANDIAIGQAVAVTDNVRFADLTVDGDLTVKGSTTQVNVANLNVEDPFILVGSGSGTGDTGIVFASGSATGGALFGFDQATNRFVYKQSAHSPMSTTDHGTAEAFASIVVKDNDEAVYRKSGNIRVDEANDEIYIYVE